MGALRLGVNVDHVATVRNARGGAAPDPVRAALIAIEAGADGITAHLREDRRHIHDDDMRRLKAAISKPLNFEMAATEAMLDIALRIRPHACCLVPENRTERTTEGGLNVVGGFDRLKPFVAELDRAGIRVSLFIEPSIEALDAAAALRAPVVELHTGAWCDALAREERERARPTNSAGCGSPRRRRAARPRMPRRPRPRLRHGADDRRVAADRRTQHRPLPRRRGDLRRPRRVRAADAGGDGRKGGAQCASGAAAMIIGVGSDLCDIRRVEETLARSASASSRAASPKSSAGARKRAPAAPPPTPSASPPRRPAPRRSARAAPWRVLARHGRRQSADRPADDAVDRRRRGASGRHRAGGPEAFIHLTITDEHPLAQAFVVIEAR